MGIRDFQEDPKKAFVFVPGVVGGSISSWAPKSGEGKGVTALLMDREMSENMGDGVRAGGGTSVTCREPGGDPPNIFGFGNPSHRLA